MRLVCYIGWRFLRSPRQERVFGALGWVSLAGMVLGVAALVVSTTVLESFRRHLLQATFGVSGHAWVMGEQTLEEVEAVALAQRLEILEGVRSAEPYVRRQAFVEGVDGFVALRLRGMALDGVAASKGLPKGLAEGLMQRVQVSSLWGEDGAGGREGRGLAGLLGSEAGGTGVLLSEQLARDLGLEVGDAVRLISSTTRLTPLGPLPFIKSFTLEGVITGGVSGEELLGVVSLLAARRLYGLGQRVDGVSLVLHNPGKPNVQALSQAAGGYQVRTWADRHRALFQVMQLERLGLWGVLSLIILVSVVNISASLAMMVQEKRGALAVLKTLGLQGRLLRWVFVLQGLWIGLAGSVGGLLLGMTLSAAFVAWANTSGQQVFSDLLLSWNWPMLASLAVGVLALGALAGAWPARLVEQAHPAEVLREY